MSLISFRNLRVDCDTPACRDLTWRSGEGCEGAAATFVIFLARADKEKEKQFKIVPFKIICYIELLDMSNLT